MTGFLTRKDCYGLLKLYGFLHELDDLPDSVLLRESWDCILEYNDFFTYFVADSGGLLVASCGVSIIPNLTRGARPFAVIENVVVHPDYRRKGLGKAAVSAAVDFAREKNCHKVVLLSNVKRKEAHIFYRELGFSCDETKGFILKL